MEDIINIHTTKIALDDEATWLTLKLKGTARSLQTFLISLLDQEDREVAPTISLSLSKMHFYLYVFISHFLVLIYVASIWRIFF